MLAQALARVLAPVLAQALARVLAPVLAQAPKSVVKNKDWKLQYRNS